MGIMVRTSKPLLCQSKLFCFSLTYLFLSVFLACFPSLSRTKCRFPLFDYPPSYGEHKHAIPTIQTSCGSPVFFSDYWTVLSEIQRLSENSSSDSKVLRYKHRDGNGRSFGMNYSTQKRLSYFDYGDGAIEIPCGFFKKFPISDSDKIGMKSCDGVVIVSAIFGDHDKIRQPKGLGYKTLAHTCFYMFVDEATLKQLIYHNLTFRKNKENKIGVWRIVKVSSQNLYENLAMNGVIPKYLVHRLFPNSKYSIWVDAKLQLTVDPLLLIHSLVIEKDVDMAVSKHPFFVHTIEEAMATARWKKWLDIDSLRNQIETYCENGLQPWSPQKLPYPSDVPDTALILRKHGVASNLFSCLLFNELEAFNPRDQLAFAFVRDRMNPKMKINMFDVEVFEHVTSEYRHNLKPVRSSETQVTRFKRASLDLLVNGTSVTKCDRYLEEMWGKSYE